MIWSARPNTDCGIVRPSAFAVFRLTTSSNFVGGEVTRFGALQDPVHERGGAPLQIEKVWAIGHEPAGDRAVARPDYRGQSPLRGELCDLSPLGEKMASERIRSAPARSLIIAAKPPSIS